MYAINVPWTFGDTCNENSLIELLLTFLQKNKKYTIWAKLFFAIDHWSITPHGLA